MKINTIYPRDIIALILIFLCFILKMKGLDGTVSVTFALIVGYYFSKRVYEENNNK